MSVYKWSAGSHMQGDPQVAGMVCERLRSEDRLTPSELVRDSEPEDAPLHGYFTWDNDVAADKYRQVEAGRIIRSLVIDVTKDDDEVEPIRLYFNVVNEDGHHRYDRVDLVMSDEDKVAHVLREAKCAMDVFIRKYRQIEELAPVIAAMETFFVNDLVESDVVA